LLGKVHGPGNDARRVAPTLREGGEPVAHHEPDERDARRAQAHLGPYAALIAAIRDELADFAERQLRLHLAIAERDRYVLASIEVACEHDEAHAALLKRFMAEFTPEQIKRYLAREVIAGLRNASAIDLAQFAGLNVERPSTGDDDPYAALIAELGSGNPDAGARPYAVTLVGRWVRGDALASDGPARPRDERAATGSRTPLAAREATLTIDDARGRRRVELAHAVPGRRYAIGKDPNADIVVDGTYVSRRHGELWLDDRGWWIVDAGSTNGLRVDGKPAGARGEPLALAPGATVVLSAQAKGEPKDYPRLRLEVAARASTEVPATDVGTRAAPATPLAPAKRLVPSLPLTVRMASGERELDLADQSLPFGIGRSRNQSLVIDGAHADVSGRHVEIVGLDDAGASVVVHGDNGVTVEGIAYGSGARFVWKRGETMVLGRGDASGPACTVALSR
jgi:pSer/pThr/pTyr-binding forkhead associated (FHA) protein